MIQHHRFKPLGLNRHNLGQWGVLMLFVHTTSRSAGGGALDRVLAQAAPVSVSY